MAAHSVYTAEIKGGTLIGKTEGERGPRQARRIGFHSLGASYTDALTLLKRSPEGENFQIVKSLDFLGN